MTHGAGAAGFPTRNRAALALVFFMHMLALFVWMRQRPDRLPALPELPEAVMFVQPVAPPRPPAPASRTEAAPPPAADPHRRPMRLPRAPAAGIPAPADTAPSPATDLPAAEPTLDAARPSMSVQDAIREQKEAEGGFAVGLAKRQAGRIDRALRKGKSGVPDEPDTPMGRFRRALEAAHIDRSKAVYEDSYTSPDGTIIYRKRIGKREICRRSGSVSPLGMRGMVMGNEAGDVPCPRGVEWKSD